MPNLAKDLYTSTLFVGRRRYVERHCDEWWILSAEHGLVHPDMLLEPYDVALKGQSRPALRQWGVLVLEAINARIQPAAGEVFEFHAGAEYRDFGVADGLRSQGCAVENPTSHMGIGHQLQFYGQNGG